MHGAWLATNFKCDRKFTDQGIDLPQKHLWVWATLEITAYETIFVHADVESSGAGIFDCGRSILFHQGKHTQGAADGGLSLPVVQQLAELASLGACMCSPPQELRCAQRHFLGVICFFDAVSAAFLTEMFAKLISARMQDAHVQRVPLH